MCVCVCVCVCAHVCVCVCVNISINTEIEGLNLHGLPRPCISEFNSTYIHTGNTNKEFNFRHDWNSLISDDDTLQMKHYTKAYFPLADNYVSWPPIHFAWFDLLIIQLLEYLV